MFFKKKLKASYDDLSYEEKLNCFTLWRDYAGLNEKIVKIVLGNVIEDYAKDSEQVDFARKILQLQNVMICSYWRKIEEERQQVL